jgi:hypothetical protein
MSGRKQETSVAVRVNCSPNRDSLSALNVTLNETDHGQGYWQPVANKTKNSSTNGSAVAYKYPTYEKVMLYNNINRAHKTIGTAGRHKHA